MKRVIFILFMLAMILVNTTTAFAKPKDDKVEKNEERKQAVELIITNLTENQIVATFTEVDFEAKVIASNKLNGIIRWELKDDSTGTGFISDDGVIVPNHIGDFKVRALYFESEKKYQLWLSNKVKNDKYIIGSSKWYNIVVQDVILPEMTLIDDPVLFVQTGSNFVDPGVKAYDIKDGDITNLVKVSGNDFSTENPGEYYISYEVVNSSGELAQAIRVVVVTDLINSDADPKIVLNGYYYTFVSVGTSYTESGARAFDDKDGEITGNIIIGGDVVDANREGIYYVKYDVQDSAGLSAEQMRRKVIVIDWNKPIDYDDPMLTLNGDYSIELNVGDPYVEQGVSAWDDVDGDLSNKVIIDSNLDVNIPGSYQITYSVMDAAGNVAYPLIRRIEVRDRIAPVITLNGNQLTYLMLGQDYIDEGATAIDNIDGDISCQVMISDPVDTSRTGIFIIEYFVRDASGNYAHTYRCVIISDEYTQFKPMIVLNGYYYTYVDLGTSYTELGARAFDDKDGEITDNIIIGGDVVDPNVEGIYFVTYDVQDSAGLSASHMMRKVIVIDWNKPIDYDDPIISLNGDPEYIMNAGETYIEQGVTAWDAVDGDISNNVIIKSNLNTNIPGFYEITYSVKDTAGNVGYSTRLVKVNGVWRAPIITLNGDQVIFLTKGQNYVEPGVTANDNLKNDITGKVEMSGSVDTNTVGMYFLHYSVYDTIGSYGWAHRWVIVSEENQLVQPMIVLNGDYLEIVELGTEYTEKGARAYDEKDGEITSNIIIDGDVIDANVEGVYFVTYQITDSDGLSYNSVRKVVVLDSDNPIDYTEPELRLFGEYFIEINKGETFIEPGYSASDDVDGDITASVKVESKVDINTAGVYTLIYTVSDNQGNKTAQIRTVTVRDSK